MTLKDDTRIVITLGFCAILVLMSLLVYVALKQQKNLSYSMSNLIEETNAKIEAAYLMRDSIRLRANSLMSMALSSDAFERDEEFFRFTRYSGMYRKAREKLIAKQTRPSEKSMHVRLTEVTRAAQPYMNIRLTYWYLMRLQVRLQQHLQWR